MKGKMWLSIIGLAAGGMLVLALLLVTGGTAGEWHSGTNNVCWDCHTMHFSMQHNWDGTTPVPTTAAPGGSWLSASGPNNFLLKAPANQLCLACHDGQTFAPDVLDASTNAMSTNGRSAGALNDQTGTVPYQIWKGHTLGSTSTPPGFDPTKIGAPATWYDPTGGLECISCHAQHGPTTAYRNLGPYSLAGAAASARPTYKFSTTPFDFASLCRNETAASGTCDVRVNLASYTAGTGIAGTFTPYYDASNISYGRNDALVALPNKTSNRLDTFCGACHGNFHGGPGDTNIGASVAALDGFIRHPTSQVTIGASGTQGYGGHSALTRYTGAVTKVPAYSVTAGYTDASPGCPSCHKAHGNQNPFGLIFLNRNATVGAGTGDQFESGGYTATQTADMAQGYRNLCGQCHGQGN